MNWSISPHVAWTYDEDAVAVATVPDTQVYRLDGSGRIIWDALVEHPGATTDQIVVDVASAAQVSADHICEDVMSYLRHLEFLGIVIAKG
ncbi:PqqD family peptide modification chaperone [Cutibacterium equinum]|uniref:PqqD family peptide modification chaperone n=1 Tax=Cutibacterium equinum TaxID=3016342 RepID=A0ABY7QZJ1_9ACTN|nr:PqqD family peptide modification chaperone [Cutibacterium equinum]WCC80115.1 PqqD family peptide modification chaperone [Cutibacterium equinum]